MFIDDIPVTMLGDQSVMTCDFDMKCYFLNNKRSSFVFSKFDQNGIELPFENQGKYDIASFKQMAFAMNNSR